jgi:hypothetical protein
VAEIVARVMDAASDEDLEQDQIPRRQLVWTLEYLLWPEDTYELAVSALLRLAEHETESFANNASGVLVDSFQSHLGGTVRRLISSRLAIWRCETPSAAIALTLAHSDVLRTSRAPSCPTG